MTTGREALRRAIRQMLNELGEPTDDYPAPVVNAVAIGKAALEHKSSRDGES